jgi:polyisoprenoid-binding protein YceI
MRIRRSTRVLVMALSGVALITSSARGNEPLRVTSGEIAVVCPLTIGGNFEAKTTAIDGEVAPAAGGVIKGALVVDLMKLDTGISLRNRHLRNNYLEVQKGDGFAVAKLENIKVERLPGKTTFKGTLQLHGQQREVSGTADVQQAGNGYKLTATFPVRVSEFQIPEPTYLGVGVQDEVTVNVTLTAVPAAAAATTAGGAGKK